MIENINSMALKYEFDVLKFLLDFLKIGYFDNSKICRISYQYLFLCEVNFQFYVFLRA